MRLRLCGIIMTIAMLFMAVGGTVAATERYALPGDNVFPEGIGANAATGEFYVGSTTSGTVFRGKVGEAAVEPFLPGGADGRTDVRGLKISSNGRLYLAGGPTAQLFVYDGASEALLAKFATGLTPSFVNDVTIAPNGDAFFTDSNSPAIYRVAADVTAPDAFSRWIDLTGSPIVYGQGFNLNGIAASADGQYLVTVQSNVGKLFRIEIATKAVTEIDLGGATLMGGDGLLLDGRTLWVMRNAANTLVTLNLAADFASATVVGTTTDPDFDFPTTFARVGAQLLVVNSQLNKRSANQPPVLPFVILGLPVPGAALPPAPSPVPSVVPVPSPPPTGGGGVLPGLPSTGAGGGSEAAPIAAVLALGVAALGLGAVGLARSRRRRV